MLIIFINSEMNARMRSVEQVIVGRKKTFRSGWYTKSLIANETTFNRFSEANLENTFLYPVSLWDI